MRKRSHRRSGGARRARSAVDWVYRPSGEFSTTLGAWNGSQPTLQGTNSIATATINSAIYCLYDSTDYLRKLTAESFGASTNTDMPMAARSEGHRVIAHRVQGTILWWPTTGWASNSQYMWGMRLIWCEQDPHTGGALLDPSYSMWEPDIAGAVPHSDVATYANNRLLNMREQRHGIGFNLENPNMIRRTDVNWKVPIKRCPSSLHALMLYVEAPANGLLALTTTTARFIVNLRTLVSDEG